MSKTWEKIFHFGAFVTQGSSYLSPHTYGILHRMHHANADTPEDPHSPKYDSSLFSMMWRTKTIYSNIFYNRVEVEDKYKKDLPEWHSFEKFADAWPVRIFWGLFYIAFYVYFATAWWQFLFLPIHFFMSPIHGAVINWFAHKYGYRNYEVSDTSKNLMPVDIFMLGEGFHNNHHKFGARPNFAKKWFELDPVYPFIKAFDILGIIKIKSGQMDRAY